MAKVTAVCMDTITEKSGHQMTGMAVSVCITPAAPSPLPIPYPTMGTVSEGIIDPCMRTKIEGAKILTVGGCMKACHGNEPGTLKEVVSLNTGGPCFPILGAPVVFIELGMAGITGSIGQMNKAITVGAGANASGAGGGGGGGGSGGAGGGAPSAGGPQGPSNGGGGGGGSNAGASPPDPPAPPQADGQAKTGHPVDVITGAMFTLPCIDFELPGPNPLQWVRRYCTSASSHDAGIGWGWSHSFAWRAIVEPTAVVVFDAEGSPIRFARLDEGEIAAAPFGRTLERRGADLVVCGRDRIERVLRRDGSRQYRLVEVRDGHGNSIDVEWNDGEVVSVTDSVGRRLVRERTGRIDMWRAVLKGEDDKEHRLLAFSYEYDEEGDLVRAIDAGGALTEYRYDDHYLVEERRPDGLVFHFRYEDGADGKRRCVETWGDLEGRDILSDLGAAPSIRSVKGIHHSRLQYGPAPYETVVIDGTGGVHRYLGNALGLVERYIDPIGRETRLQFDAHGHLLSATEPSGATTRYGRDHLGRLTHSTDPLGRRITLRRDEHGNVAEVVGVTGTRWGMRHDAAGKITARTDPSGATTKTEYDARGLAARTTGPGGTESIVRDAHGNIIERIDVRGASWKYTYDLLGLPVRIDTPAGCSYELSYDSRGDITAVEGPHGRRNERQYDAMQRLVAERHPGGGLATYDYVADAPIARNLPDGTSLRYGYDALLRLSWIQNQAGERHVNEYDAAGQLVHHRTFAGVEHRFEYDARGNVARRIDADGRALSITRDAAGQIVRRRHDDGSETIIERDERGFIVAASNGQVTVRFERDGAGRVRRETQSAGGFQFAVEHEYDPLGYVVATRYSSGFVVTRRRGKGGVLERLVVHRMDGSVVESIDFDYGAREIAKRTGRKDGTITTRDKLGRATRIQVLGQDGRPMRERSYEWSATPGLLAIQDDKHGSRTYSLDVFGRPVAVSGLGVEDAIRYSPHGTPIARSEGKGAQVGPAGRKTKSRSVSFRWDSQGRLANEIGDSPTTSWSFDYDGDDQLVAATRGDGYRLRYLYDPFGRRVAILRQDGTSQWFGWDGPSCVEERGSGGATARFVFQDDGFTPILDSPDGESWRLVATDTARTPWLYLGKDGDLSDIDLTPSGAEARKTGSPSTLRLAGQRFDRETGLCYQHHRYYSPRLGTFMTPDPLGLIGSLHDIGFVPNATEYLDPLGLIIVLGSYDAEATAAAQARSQATGQSIVHANALGPGSLAGENHVEVITHGNPDGGKAVFDDGSGQRWHNGRSLGNKLQNAGLAPGAEVVVVACNASQQPARGQNRESVIEGVNAATGNPTVGPSGIAYVRPGPQQICGCPPTPGAPGSVDTTTGHWDRATGGNGQPTTVAPVASPTAHAGSFQDPNAPSGHGVSH